MSDTEAVVQVRGLRMRYGSLDVLEGVAFDVHRGEVVTLLGPNGAGKTTTIEILEGFRERTSGDVRVLGVDPAGGGSDLRHRLVRRLVDLEETTILLTTHDLDEAEKLADRILILAGGRIVADGRAEELARSISSESRVRWRMCVTPATAGMLGASKARSVWTWMTSPPTASRRSSSAGP